MNRDHIKVMVKCFALVICTALVITGSLNLVLPSGWCWIEPDNAGSLFVVGIIFGLLLSYL